jgi:transcriptional regulator with XRE-family HTH domain
VKKATKSKRVLIFDEEGLKLLAKHLKKVRMAKGFSQEELAYESGMTLSQIARIETVKINPTVSTIFKLARTLQVPVSDLFDFKLPKEN